jgi:CO dehydrogenase/acetyl-CoA synthase epsilon subunit
MSDDNPGKMIRPPNKLSSKVTIGGPGAVDDAALERAEKVIDNLAVSYVDWAREDLDKIQAAFESLKSSDGGAEALESVFQISHDIKGQGGSFDYDMMTIIGDMLCRYIESLEGEATPQAVEVVGLHINGLQAVISQKLKGDGGAVGEQLMSGLELVVKKRTKAT